MSRVLFFLLVFSSFLVILVSPFFFFWGGGGCFVFLEMVLEECYDIIGFIVILRWFQMSALT